MGVTLTWLGVSGVAVLLLAWSLALAVYLARPHGRTNRALAALLIAEGATVGLAGGLAYLFEDAPSAAAARLSAALPVFLLPPLYLVFLSTLETPLVRWLRPRAVRVGLFVYPLLTTGVLVVYPPMLDVSFELVTYSPWEPSWNGPLGTVAFLGVAASAAFGLVAAWSTFLRAEPGSVARRRAGAYAAAFSVRDVAFFVVMLEWSLARFGIPRLFEPGGTVDIYAVNVADLLFVLLLAFGILRHQVLGIELTVKRTIRRGTVVGAFLGVFFLVSEGVEQLVSGTIGTWAGLGAAALLTLVLRPLERGAARFADEVMPGVEDTPAYRRKRAGEVYRAAVSDALLDGVISGPERTRLARLQDELGLSASTALAIERELGGPARESA